MSAKKLLAILMWKMQWIGLLTVLLSKPQRKLMKNAMAVKAHKTGLLHWRAHYQKYKLVSG
ncbi:MAG: hypothetical protein DBP00_12130 [gamma proteobacterium symbiont of Ctena orbiculata]|nr:MAG: hypothetical protein DBP00_12130 [gamma proteobacterium symbiont of Ctena orbiculata]